MKNPRAKEGCGGGGESKAKRPCLLGLWSSQPSRVRRAPVILKTLTHCQEKGARVHTVLALEAKIPEDKDFQILHFCLKFNLFILHVPLVPQN